MLPQRLSRITGTALGPGLRAVSRREFYTDRGLRNKTWGMIKFTDLQRFKNYFGRIISPEKSVTAPKKWILVKTLENVYKEQIPKWVRMIPTDRISMAIKESHVLRSCSNFVDQKSRVYLPFTRRIFQQHFVPWIVKLRPKRTKERKMLANSVTESEILAFRSKLAPILEKFESEEIKRENSQKIEGRKITPEEEFSDAMRSKRERDQANLRLKNNKSVWGSLSDYVVIPNMSHLWSNTTSESKVGESQSEKSPKEKKATSNVKSWRVRGPSSVSKADIDTTTRNLTKALKNRGDSNPSFDSSAITVSKLEAFCVHLQKYPWAKGVAVRNGAIGELLSIRGARSENDDSVGMLLREALDLVGYHDPPNSRGIRILCMDGGGMKGIIACEVLKKFEAITGKKICESFDLICGVSTGAIIASFLGFHKFSIEEVEEHYRNMGTKIFTRDVLRAYTNVVMSHSYYDSPAYEKILQSFVGETRMSDTNRTAGTPKVAIISTLVSPESERIVPFVFRNYHYPYRFHSYYRGSSSYPIWAAVRASSAAPGYFDEFVLDDVIHHDGGILTNNASVLAIHEAQRIWPNEPIQCLVSLGMGRFEMGFHHMHDDHNAEKSLVEDKGQTLPNDIPMKKAAKSMSLAQKFSRIVDAATDTEIAHITLRDLLPGHVYYRFNPYMSEYFQMDEVRPHKMAQMREDTQMYIRKNENRIKEACDQLTAQRTPLQRTTDFCDKALQIGAVKLDNFLHSNSVNR